MPVKGNNYFSVLGQGIKEIFKTKEVIVLIFHRIFLGTFIGLFAWCYQAYLLDRGVELFFVGICFVVLAILKLSGYKFLSILVSKLKNQHIKLSLNLTTVFTGIMFVLLSFPFPVGFCIFFMILVEFFGNTQRIYYIRGINRAVSSNRATAFSAINGIGGIILAIFYFIVAVSSIDIYALFSITGFLIIGFSVACIRLLKSEYL